MDGFGSECIAEIPICPGFSPNTVGLGEVLVWLPAHTQDLTRLILLRTLCSTPELIPVDSQHHLPEPWSKEMFVQSGTQLLQKPFISPGQQKLCVSMCTHGGGEEVGYRKGHGQTWSHKDWTRWGSWRDVWGPDQLEGVGAARTERPGGNPHNRSLVLISHRSNTTTFCSGRCPTFQSHTFASDFNGFPHSPKLYLTRRGRISVTAARNKGSVFHKGHSQPVCCCLSYLKI